VAQPDLLPFGPLTGRTAHLCIDMQNVFCEDTPWHTPWMRRVLPAVERVARHRAADTIFTRFVPPRGAEEMPGAWRRYYERWKDLTLANIDPRLLELLPSLKCHAPPAAVVDKRHYSAFAAPALPPLLKERGIDSLVITGAETDVCVLATVMAAVDLGFRVVLATDALCGSSDRTHDALLTLYRDRFGEQIETAETDTVLACWLD
jgi:nicotinamidase-related amidase